MTRDCQSALTTAPGHMVFTVERFAQLISDNAAEDTWTDVVLEFSSLYRREYTSSRYSQVGNNKSAKPLAWFLNRSTDAWGVSRVGRRAKILADHDSGGHL